MKHILYRDALSHGFHFAWKHKSLWLFGLFAAFLGQIGLMPLLSAIGLTGSGYGGTTTVSYLGMFLGSIPFSDFTTLSSSIVAGTLWIGIMFFVVVLVFLALAVVSQGALIHAASKSLKLVRTQPQATKSWHVGATHFWKLFGLQLLKKGVLLLCGAAVYFTTMYAVGTNSASWTLTSSVVFVLASIIGFILSFLLTYAACYVVVEEMSIGEAVEHAWQMVSTHWLVSIEVGVLLLASNFLLGLFAVFSFLVFFTPAFILLLISLIIGTKVLATLAAIVSLALFILFIVWIGSVFTVFSTTTWTYLFMKMHAHGVHSKILYWAGHRE